MVTWITVSKQIGADVWLVKDPLDSCIALWYCEAELVSWLTMLF